MCRYEGWYLIAGIVVLLAYDFVRQPVRRRAVVRAAALFVAAFALPAAAHFAYFHVRAGESFLARVARGHPAPAEAFHRPLVSVGYHLGELAQVAGLIPLAAAVLGIGCLRTLALPRGKGAPLFLLWLPSLANVMALYWGMIYRVRWSVLLLPAVALFAGVAAANDRVARRALRAVALAAMALPWVSAAAPDLWSYHFLRPGPGARTVPPAALVSALVAEASARACWPMAALVGIASQWPSLEGEDLPILAETLEHRDLEPERRALLDELAARYDGTRILLDIEKLAPLVYDTRLRTREFVHSEGEQRLWQRALADPAREVGWICTLRGDAVWQALDVDPHRTDRYSQAVRTEHFVLYRLADADREALRRGRPAR
jgi:hypothetical protein